MDAPLLVVVTGPPAAGKTTVARELAARLRLPLIAKDTIKEALFDGLGTGDAQWSQRLGPPTFGVMLALAEESLRAGASLVLEANFVRGGRWRRDLPHFPPASCRSSAARRSRSCSSATHPASGIPATSIVLMLLASAHHQGTSSTCMCRCPTRGDTLSAPFPNTGTMCTFSTRHWIQTTLGV